LALVAEPLTRMLFQHGQFTAADAERTAGILLAYGTGVWAYCGIPVLYRGFYAVGERRIPVILGLSAVALDLTLNLRLVWARAASAALSARMQGACRAWLIQKRVGGLDWLGLARPAAKALLARGVMSAVCLAALRYIPAGSGTLGEGVALVVAISLALVSYF